MNIFVGNLSRDVTEEELRQLFEAFGQVDTVSIIKDKLSGQPRGFAFVEMAVRAEGEQAVEALNGKPVKRRPLTVNEARPRESRGVGGGSGGPRPGGGTNRPFGGPADRRGGPRRA